MSTLNHAEKEIVVQPPDWTCLIPAGEYFAAAYNGSVLSSTTLKEFRRCPAYYRALTSGRAEKRVSDAFRFGRAVHTLVLEGKLAFARAFVVGGPVNEKSGRSYSAGSKAFARWLDEYGLDREQVVTVDECETMQRMWTQVFAHPEAARLLERGWPERCARAEVEGLRCQSRIDWLCEDGIAVDLKTIDDITRFEQDARRFGYLNQFAFYRDVARAAGGVELDIRAVVVEKKPPFRVGVWAFCAEVLEPYAVQNRQAMARLRRCRRDGRWPTGYEAPRVFPPAGIPPLWLN